MVRKIFREQSGNTNSYKLIERLNFVKEGLLRQYELGASKFDDLYMYSLLKEDFNT